ncbi:hypothetical protein Taro_056544, partial [Colocasia esculenta]|nr:hypothetical protein [Colocasia esculenta]
ILTGPGYGSVLVFNSLDINSGLASRVLHAGELGGLIDPDIGSCFFGLSLAYNVRYPRFFVSQARVFVVLGVLSRYLCCTVEVWCWLVSTVVSLVLVERQLDLSSVTVRLRGVVLVGLHSCLTCSRGAAVGPFVRDCEAESCGLTRALPLVVVREFVTRGRGKLSDDLTRNNGIGLE